MIRRPLVPPHASSQHPSVPLLPPTSGQHSPSFSPSHPRSSQRPPTSIPSLPPQLHAPTPPSSPEQPRAPFSFPPASCLSGGSNHYGGIISKFVGNISNGVNNIINKLGCNIVGDKYGDEGAISNSQWVLGDDVSTVQYTTLDSPFAFEMGPSCCAWLPTSYQVAAAGPREAQAEATVEEALPWLCEHGLIPEGSLDDAAAVRRYQALSGG